MAEVITSITLITHPNFLIQLVNSMQVHPMYFSHLMLDTVEIQDEVG